MIDRDVCILGILLAFAFGQIFGVSQFLASMLFSVTGLDLPWVIEEISLLLILITLVLTVGALSDRTKSKLKSKINLN